MLTTLKFSLRNLRICCQFRETHQKSFSERPDPKEVPCDYIGPADPVSHIRPFVRHIPKNETKLGRQLRELRTLVDAQNHEFWKKNNEEFVLQKQAFINHHKGLGDDEVSADKLSEFYKQFLDENYERHLAYNKRWYKQNFQMLKLSFAVEIEKIVKRLFIIK